MAEAVREKLTAIFLISQKENFEHHYKHFKRTKTVKDTRATLSV